MYSVYFKKWVKEEYPWANWVVADRYGWIWIYAEEPLLSSEGLDWKKKNINSGHLWLDSLEFFWLEPIWKETKQEL